MKKTLIKTLSALTAAALTAGVMSLCALAGFAPVAQSASETASSFSGYYEYYITDEGTACICDVDGSISGDIVIPDMLGGCPVTEIEHAAFWGAGIKSVVIPGTVKYIGLNAFGHCGNLESVVISDSVEGLETSAFSGCKKLDSITLPETTGLGFDVFKGTAYYNNSANWEDGVLYLGKHLLVADKNTVAGMYQIKDGTTQIACGAFAECDGLTGIIIPASVTEIDSLFRGCENLSQITLPDTAIRLYGRDFFDTALYKNSANWENGVLYIGKHLIEANGTSLSGNYVIKDGTRTVAEEAFQGCGRMTGITIPPSVVSIGGWAFENCKSLTGVFVPDSVAYIGYNAFADCDGLAGITVGDGNMHYASDAYGALFDKGKTELVKYPAANGATSYSIPDTVKRIGRGAFYGCGSLADVTIPASVTLIDDSAFECCVRLTGVTVPSSVRSIRWGAFASCERLADIRLPDSVRYIGTGAFSGTAYSGKASNWENGLLYVGNHLVGADFDVVSGNCKIRAGTLTVAHHVFSNYELTSVMIPASVRVIGNFAFENCGNLTDIYYAGAQTDWLAVETGCYNGFADRTMHYDSNVVIINGGDLTVPYCKTAALSADLSAEGYSVGWSSSRPCVAKVDKDGNVTARFLGTAVITARVVDENGSPVKDKDGKEITDTCTVTVRFEWWRWVLMMFASWFKAFDGFLK